MISKELLSASAIALTFIAFIPYIRSILQGKTKPHAFSWLIWSTVTFIVFLAQLSDDAGVGAWPIGISGFITMFVALLAYLKKTDHMITKTDWLFFIVAMMSLPFWYFTSDPLWAVVLLTTVDLIGFGPTFSKAYVFPFEEQLTFFIIITARNAIAIMALEHYSLTTYLFPAATGLTCFIFILMVLVRRRML